MSEIDFKVSYRQHEHDKKWEYRIRFTDPFTEKPTERSIRGFRTKTEARTAAKARIKKLEKGVIDKNVKLKDYLDFWLREYKLNKVAKNSYKSLKNSVENHIKPYFKEMKVTTVDPNNYQVFLNYLYNEKKLEKNTILKIHNAFYNAMKRAKINKLIVDNPCEDADVPNKKKHKKKDQIKFIDSSDIQNFLTQAFNYGYIYWIFFDALIDTGLRKGEAAALQWTDIDFKNRLITVNKTLDFQADNINELFGDPKSFNAERTIKISKSLVSKLRSHLNWQNQNKQFLNDSYHHDLNLVFCRKDGNFMPKSSLFNAFSRILKRADLEQLPIHSLRHTHAVLQLEAGADMKYIQERLGHGSYQITADVYAHISKKIEKRDTDKYEEYMNSILNK